MLNTSVSSFVEMLHKFTDEDRGKACK